MTWRKGTKRIGLLIAAIVILGSVAGVLFSDNSLASNGQACTPGSYSNCPKNYICKNNVCECAWGDLEVGLLNIDAGDSICALIAGPEGGVGALLWFMQQAVTAVMALTIMAAAVSIVIGGYIYMTAGGDADRVRTAKVWIEAAILGIILALLAWLILRSIATNLVQFPTPTSSSTPTSSPAATSMGAP